MVSQLVTDGTVDPVTTIEYEDVGVGIDAWGELEYDGDCELDADTDADALWDTEYNADSDTDADQESDADAETDNESNADADAEEDAEAEEVNEDLRERIEVCVPFIEYADVCDGILEADDVRVRTDVAEYVWHVAVWNKENSTIPNFSIITTIPV